MEDVGFGEAEEYETGSWYTLGWYASPLEERQAAAADTLVREPRSPHCGAWRLSREEAPEKLLVWPPE